MTYPMRRRGRMTRPAWLLFLGAVWLAFSTACAGPVAGVHEAAPGSCEGGPTRPLTKRVVVSNLRKHGFAVRSSTNSDLCQAFDPSLGGNDRAAFEISNGGSASPDDVEQNEGTLSCILRKGPIWGAKLQKDLDAPSASPIFNGRKAEFYVENVDCVLYPGGHEPDAQVSRLERALESLVRGRRSG
jgi:hypothetical protein